MKNKNGFTLVELLAVIVILSLLALLTSTAVTKLVKDSKEDLYQTQIELIKASAEAWGADNIYKLPSEGKCAYITVENLKQYGILDSSVVDPRTNEQISDSLKIKISSKTGEYGGIITTYEVDPESVSGCTWAINPICVSATLNTITTGNVPTGRFLAGDEYICNVNGGQEPYRFFVLSTDNDNVNLIMDHSVNNTGGSSTDISDSATPYLSADDGSGIETGPITAFNFLSTATSSWTLVPKVNMNYTYSDSTVGGFSTSSSGTVSIINTSGVTTATYDNLKARLPYESELTAVGCTTSSGSCPSWLTGNIYGAAYWTIPTSTSGLNVVITSSNLSPASGVGGITSEYVVTARPVITLPKYSLSNFLLGDVNNDGVVDDTDVTVLKKIGAGAYNGEFSWEKADLNNDGIVNMTDLNYLKRMLNTET